MNAKPYFLRLQDYDAAKLAGMLPAGTVAFMGPSWVLVTFTDEQRKRYTYPIVEFFGQSSVTFE